jgi:hypothetical protein
MIKITGTVLVAVAMLAASSAFAGDKAGCAKGVSNKEKAACADFAYLNVSAEQKTKLETWQADCMKAGCTKESRANFLKQAKGILSSEQYAKLKTECDKSANAKKTEA